MQKPKTQNLNDTRNPFFDGLRLRVFDSASGTGGPDQRSSKTCRILGVAATAKHVPYQQRNTDVITALQSCPTDQKARSLMRLENVGGAWGVLLQAHSGFGAKIGNPTITLGLNGPPSVPGFGLPDAIIICCRALHFTGVSRSPLPPRLRNRSCAYQQIWTQLAPLAMRMIDQQRMLHHPVRTHYPTMPFSSTRRALSCRICRPKSTVP